jgi:hypothetical protein
VGLIRCMFMKIESESGSTKKRQPFGIVGAIDA